MTTVAVCRKNGVAAIGADTLIKDNYTNVRAEYLRHSSKLIPIGENVFAPLGSGTWPLLLETYFAGLEEMPPLGNEIEIYHAMLGLHEAAAEHHHLNDSGGEDEDFNLLKMSCLLANPHGVFAIYRDHSVSDFAKFYAFGSGYKFAVGAMRVVYEQSDDPAEIVRAGLDAAADFDEDTGAPIEVVTIQLLDKS